MPGKVKKRQRIAEEVRDRGALIAGPYPL